MSRGGRISLLVAGAVLAGAGGVLGVLALDWVPGTLRLDDAAGWIAAIDDRDVASHRTEAAIGVGAVAATFAILAMIVLRPRPSRAALVIPIRPSPGRPPGRVLVRSSAVVSAVRAGLRGSTLAAGARPRIRFDRRRRLARVTVVPDSPSHPAAAGRDAHRRAYRAIATSGLEGVALTVDVTGPRAVPDEDRPRRVR
jgi:hypothetical protein